MNAEMVVNPENSEGVVRYDIYLAVADIAVTHWNGDAEISAVNQQDVSRGPTDECNTHDECATDDDGDCFTQTCDTDDDCREGEDEEDDEYETDVTVSYTCDDDDDE